MQLTVWMCEFKNTTTDTSCSLKLTVICNYHLIQVQGRKRGVVGGFGELDSTFWRFEDVLTRSPS